MTVRVTPAMQAGLADHPWTLKELVTAALAEPEAAPAPSSPTPTLGCGAEGEQLSLLGEAAAPTRPALRLIKSGKCAAKDVARPSGDGLHG